MEPVPTGAAPAEHSAASVYSAQTNPFDDQSTLQDSEPTSPTSATSSSIHSSDDGMALPANPGAISRFPTSSAHLKYELHFGSPMDFRVTDETRNTVYYIDNKAVFFSGAPDMLLHQGPDKSSPIVGACKCHGKSWKCQVCFGDPTTASGDAFHTLLPPKPLKRNLTWSPPGSTRLVTWKHTHGPEVKERGAKTWKTRHLKLVDAETGEMLAIYLAGVAWKRIGSFEIKPDAELGERWIQAVLLTGCCLVRKDRRGGG